ncbi:ribose-phosphate pyrophosphokinase [Desulfarculus baarsii DSM 2075]|uniref:Ribose-phosphate pyrophosphokinase n=1 Tax=Desulfarculus baarsii (strain ATCC 33931 / DSM 2075 / LMG 7858 / VKM B-1802 / 2st14) TaxID=644282 RepID=E1QEW3_DESB2|nr:ribose-phosphate pyrophosphokinase [Desulfarculus baarsii]ADK84099.1 ribose-phosphate pyrophosphokinase [Desulfarculus baarsii DSM 2075]
MFNKLKVFTGNSNPALAEEICHYLHLPLSQAVVRRFSDGEILVEIGENVRGSDVFVIQSTCPPVNDHLMELLIMIDAFRRASARRITAVIPYYGYARQDRKVAPRAPISAKLVADLITTAGAGRVLCMDLHAGQIGGFFNIPVDHLFATPVILDYLRTQLRGEAVIVSPDAGGVERARAIAKRLSAGLAIIDKRREKANVAQAMNIIGEVDGKMTVILDDMIDTAGTLTEAARALIDHGAKEVWACSSHAVLSGPAVTRIKESSITRVVTTNTVPMREEAKNTGKISSLSVAQILGEAIRRIHMEDSVSSLFV